MTKINLLKLFRPDRYLIELNSPPKVVVAGLRPGRPTKRFTFHQKNLKISGAKIIHKSKKGEVEIPVIRINHHKSFEQVRLHTEQPLYKGNYVITMNYRSKNRLPTKNPDDLAKIIGNGSRNYFPSIDEPEAKAQVVLKDNE